VAALTLYGPVLTDGRELPPGRVEIGEGRIRAVVPGESRAGADLVADDGWIAPGLIDLQVNGAGGVDLTSAVQPAEAVAVVARTLARHGVTAFCPTIVSSPVETVLGGLAAFGPRAHPGGAESLGAHVEGPFIDPDHRGVHDPATLRRPDGHEIGGILGDPTAVTASWGTLFEVEDTDATVARVIAAGGTSTTPSDFVYGRIAEIRDPFGARFSVGSRPSHSQG
jgi:N-acetylglucosamine-6-phosphate deacetylase